jgi:hypothetical protein
LQATLLNFPFIVLSVTTTAPASDFSPATQAVLDAAFDPWQSTDTPASIAAAALRAVADQLSYEDSEGRRFLYVPEILAIAAELETQ